MKTASILQGVLAIGVTIVICYQDHRLTVLSDDFNRMQVSNQDFSDGLNRMQAGNQDFSEKLDKMDVEIKVVSRWVDNATPLINGEFKTSKDAIFSVDERVTQLEQSNEELRQDLYGKIAVPGQGLKGKLDFHIRFHDHEVRDALKR